MSYRSKIAVLGGDLRQVAVANALCEAGAEIYASGLCAGASEGVSLCEGWEEALIGACAVILPLPVSMDERTLNCPARLGKDRITLDRIIDLADKRATVFGGRIPTKMAEAAQRRGISVFDYFLSEPLQIQNAYLTAEAAVSIAMNSLDKRLGEARVAVTGSGRIARFLVRILRALGASVTVAARRRDSLAYFALDGADTLHITAERAGEECRWYSSLESGYDIIFNTVPAWLFDRDFLERVDKGTLIIELASSPGGVDICAARELCSNVMWAPSLPGKYAPRSAGRIIAECVLGELEGRI